MAPIPTDTYVIICTHSNSLNCTENIIHMLNQIAFDSKDITERRTEKMSPNAIEMNMYQCTVYIYYYYYCRIAVGPLLYKTQHYVCYDLPTTTFIIIICGLPTNGMYLVCVLAAVYLSTYNNDKRSTRMLEMIGGLLFYKTANFMTIRHISYSHITLSDNEIVCLFVFVS